MRALVLAAMTVAILVTSASGAVAASPQSCANPTLGTKGPDRLIGTGARDAISAGRGRDVVAGRGRADCLEGGRGADELRGGRGRGRDILIGGPGNDRIHAHDGVRDIVRCGRGRDTAIIDRYDEVTGCERVKRPGGETPSRAPARSADGGPEAPGTEPDVDGGPAETGDFELADRVGCLALLDSACSNLMIDTAADPDPVPTWGTIDCETGSRHELRAGGGDTAPGADGRLQGNDAFRRLTVFDGDDVWGERCELGHNSHRTNPGPLYREGERRVTYMSMRLHETYPLEEHHWQVVMQMKQTAPAANQNGTPVLALHARHGRWVLVQSTSTGLTSQTHDLWSTPAKKGRWTRFAFDITYSQDAGSGSVKVHVDLNGDGDTDDAGEQSPRFDTYTLKREIAGGDPDDGIEPGGSIPSHLRVGMYHDTVIDCPAPAGCSVDVDNVQVVKPE